MKKTLIWLLKLFISGSLALAIVSGLCFFYYNLPVHYTNISGATDYLWDQNHISIRANEGFAYTKTDEYGFVNTFPNKKDKVDVLVMGSSHGEGFNVNADQNFTYRLNQKFTENGHDLYAYSIATSGHAFIRCLKNLDAAVKTYSPTECVVIETYKIEFDVKELEQLNSNTYPTLPSYNSGLIYHLQKLDFFRLAYSQASNFIAKDAPAPVSAPQKQTDLEKYKNLVESAIEKAGKIGADNNSRIIIVYCPTLELDYFGKVIPQSYTPQQEIFKAACEKYNVEFVDMYTSFQAEYTQAHHLPHGFANTQVGTGHTNKYGHNCIAEVLYSIITQR